MTPRITFVSAGAGSGKTRRLTEILHTKLASGAAYPAGVIATTFTVKAAAELRERTRTYLMQQKQFALATALDEARIGTVNSVCGQLLSRFCFEAGLPTEQQVLGEEQAKVLLRQAIDGVLDGPQLEALRTVAERLGIEAWSEDLRSLVDQVRANDIDPATLAAMASANADDLIHHFPKASAEDLDAALGTAIDAVLPVLEQAIAAKTRQGTVDYRDLCREVRRGLDAGRTAWSQWAKLSKKIPEAGLISAAAQVTSISGRHAEHPRLQADLRNYLTRLFSLCALALAQYANRKRELGLIDFVDQEHLLLKALDHPEVQAVLADELELLMVDEFQDTSPIQLALFLKLAGLAREVVWVGDVKQAIYGFRGSDTALMEAVLRSLPAIGGTKQILTSSRRSRPPLVALVNAAFGHAFEPMLAASEVQLTAERTEPGTGAALANWMLRGANIEQEIVALGLGIRRLLELGYQVVDRQTGATRAARYGDIAVLARLNDRVIDIAAGLSAQGIPTATMQPGLMRRPEVVLAMACLRRLNDPQDSIATAEILSLADCQEPEDWLEGRLAFLAAGGKQAQWREAGDSAHPLVARLAVLRAQLAMLTPREAVELVITQGDLPRRVLQWSRSEEAARARIANLEALIDLATQYEDSCRSARTAATVSGLILWLAQQARDGSDALAQPDLDAVKVLTHHGAKGLEWPIVILLDLASKVKDRLWSISACSRNTLDLAHPLEDRFIRHWPWPYGKQQLVQIADDIARTEVAASFRAAAVDEAKRLLYVSMTRARDLLILARSARKPSGPWIDTLGAPWLLPDTPAEELALPDGSTIPYQHWELDPASIEPPAAPAPQPLRWFDAAPDPSARLPLIVTPSRAEPVPCEAGERAQIGKRIELATGADVQRVGSAMHACIAAAMSTGAHALSTAEIEHILTAWQAEAMLDPAQVLAQLDALRAWIAARWPAAGLRWEVPVEARLDNGQVVKGQADLLLETPAGWILIDHKANPRGGDAWEDVARRYSGQLKQYKDAICAATSRPVAEVWLYFPVAAGAISVHFVEAGVSQSPVLALR